MGFVVWFVKAVVEKTMLVEIWSLPASGTGRPFYC